MGPSTATPAPTPTYIAVTPAMLIGSKDQGMVRDAVAHVHSPGTAEQPSGLAADPTFQKARATLPAKLVSLSYANYANVNWQKLIADFEKNLNDQRQQTARSMNKPAPPRVELLQGFDPATFSRYLHVSIGGTWKDSKGIYFDSYIQ
jgi:hypothetical protein